MKISYELIVTLRIREPFITSTGTDAVRGLDQVFARDLHGNFMMHGSHVKGKFREALENLYAAELITQEEIDDYLGRERSQKIPPKRGKLHFTDFRLETPDPQPGRLTRIQIDSQTGTAKENALVTIEHLYKPRSLSAWTGTIAFFAESHETIAIQKTVQQGFKWITNFGAMKGNGYGRLEEVEVHLQKDEKKPVIHLPKNRTPVLTLQFEFHDPLFIGGIERGVNFKASEEIIPGSVLKGAFARFLNELCGVSVDDDTTIQDMPPVNQEFSKLAKYFSRLRFSHAFPASAMAQRRPVTIPFSTVQDAKGNAWDCALDVVNVQSGADANETPLLRFKDKEQTVREKAPAYQIDWKDSSALRAHFGWAACQTINTTRTAIEDESRTAEEERLYTFQYISPYDLEGRKIHWFAMLQLPAPQEISHEEFEKLYVNLQKAFDQGWQYLGKRDARFTLSVLPGDVEEHASRPFGLLVDDLAIVTLQTDTLLFDRRSITEKKDGQQVPALKSLYTVYWQEATDNTCELVDFFARQKMWGGYLVKQYTPADPYYPYILTEAGSVFVLRAKEQERDHARKKLQELKCNGLPHPKDIKREQTDTLWKHCPFVPENGYGEICINLAWHWERAYDNKQF